MIIIIIIIIIINHHHLSNHIGLPSVQNFVVLLFFVVRNGIANDRDVLSFVAVFCSC